MDNNNLEKVELSTAYGVISDDRMDEYSKELSAAYWAEEEEMKAGIHPSQIIPRVEDAVRGMDLNPDLISMYRWNPNGHTVMVSYMGKELGIFDYQQDRFISVNNSYLKDSISDPDTDVVCTMYKFVKYSGRHTEQVSVMEAFYRQLNSEIDRLASTVDGVTFVGEPTIGKTVKEVNNEDDRDDPTFYSNFYGDIKNIPIGTFIVIYHGTIPYRKVVKKVRK